MKSTTTMRVARLVAPGHIEITESEIPEPRSGEVLVRVAACGVCGSDLHLWSGQDPWHSSNHGPSTLGHETSGVVHAVGAGVMTVQPGDRVAIEPGFLRPCNQCRWCLSGQSQLCIDRGRWHGQSLGVAGFADFELVAGSNVYQVPDFVDLRDAVLTDIYACGIHAIGRVGPPGGRVAVIGTGALALATGQLARRSGFESVVMVGRRIAALDAAHRSGSADETLLIDHTQEPTRDLGVDADVVFDCAGGDGSSIIYALSAAARGGTLCVLGAFWNDVRLPYYLANRKEISVTFSSTYSQTTQPPEFAGAMELLAGGELDAASLITHTFPLDQLGDAFATAADKGRSAAIRVIVTP